MKGTIDKLNFIKIKNFWSVKDLVEEVRKRARDWEKIFAKGVSKIYKELLKLSNKKINNWCKNEQNTMQTPYQRWDGKYIQMANKRKKKCSTSSVIQFSSVQFSCSVVSDSLRSHESVIREMQIKTTRYHYTPIRMVRSGALTAPNTLEDVGRWGLSFIAGGDAKWHSHFGRSLVVSWASLIAEFVKNPPAMQETPVRFLGQKDPLEKG